MDFASGSRVRFFPKMKFFFGIGNELILMAQKALDLLLKRFGEVDHVAQSHIWGTFLAFAWYQCGKNRNLKLFSSTMATIG
jgi:hypothetical protein